MWRKLYPNCGLKCAKTHILYGSKSAEKLKKNKNKKALLTECSILLRVAMVFDKHFLLYWLVGLCDIAAPVSQYHCNIMVTGT